VRRVVISLLAVALFLAWAAPSYAMGRGGHGGGQGGHGFHGHGFHGHGFHGHPGCHGHQRFQGRGVIVVGPGCCWGPWWWGYPPSYYPPPGLANYPSTYYDPPASYSPPVRYAPPSATVSVAPAPPTPNVVEFATGRYELRGDGVSTPYTWVWIPNPPTAPPPPPSTPPAGEPISGLPSAPRIGQVYRWIDEQGVVHWTDRQGAVPEQYRSRVKQPMHF